MTTRKTPGGASRTATRIPSYPTNIACGLALSITMGAAASCGGDPGDYRTDARLSATDRLDAPVADAHVDAPVADAKVAAAVDAPSVDAGLDAGVAADGGDNGD